MNSNNKPLFVDLFFAVVVGSSVALIKLTEPLSHTIIRVFLIIVVLEDWYMYYRHVLPEDPKLKKYNFLSLLFEFTILLFWYLSVACIPDRLSYLPLLLGIYFLIRFLAGLMYYTPYTRKFWREFAFLVPVACCLTLFFVQWPTAQCMWSVLVCLLAAWLIQVVIWWTV